MGDYRYMSGQVLIKPELREAIGKRCIEYKDTLINNEEWTELGLPREIAEHRLFREFVTTDHVDYVPFTWSSGSSYYCKDFGPNSYVDGLLTFKCSGKDYSGAFMKFVHCLPLLADEWEVQIDNHEFAFSLEQHPNAYVKTYRHTDIETKAEHEEQAQSRAHRKVEDVTITVDWESDTLRQVSNRQLKRQFGNEGSRLVKSLAEHIREEEDEQLKQQMTEHIVNRHQSSEEEAWERGPRHSMRGGDVKIVHIDSVGFIDENPVIEARQAHNGLFYFPGDAPQGHGHKAKAKPKSKRKAQKAARRKQRK